MSSPILHKLSIEELWRKRLSDAKLHLDFARNYVAEVSVDFPMPASSDGIVARRHAIKAEMVALQEYNRVLRIYEKLVIEGVPSNEIQTGDDRLTNLLNSAIAASNADMGNIQLFDLSTNTLRIEAQLGFDSRFLEFFNRVHEGQAACGTALKTGSQVVVEDVMTSLIFAGSPSLEAMLDARARAVQSTPIIGRTGPLGILSTHYHRPVRPSERDLEVLELFSIRAANIIEGSPSL